MAPYPDQEEISQLLRHLSTDNFHPFYDRVAPDVSWDVPVTTDGSGHFDSLESWRQGALEKTNNALSAPLKFKLVNVLGGGNQPWAAAEMEALDTFGKNGMPYNQTYCWVIKFNTEGIIVQVRVYTDTQLSQDVMKSNT